MTVDVYVELFFLFVRVIFFFLFTLVYLLVLYIE